MPSAPLALWGCPMPLAPLRIPATSTQMSMQKQSIIYPILSASACVI